MTERARELIAEWDRLGVVPNETSDILRGLLGQLETLEQVARAARVLCDHSAAAKADPDMDGEFGALRFLLTVYEQKRDGVSFPASEPPENPRHSDRSYTPNAHDR